MIIDQEIDLFKCVKGENSTTSFLPLNSKGGPVRYVKDRNTMCLTEEQIKYFYKKVEQGSEINTEKMKQEIDQQKLTEIETKKRMK